MKPGVFHPEASAEALDSRATYDAKSFELGDRFAAAVAAMVAEVCRAPQRYRFVRRPVRRHLERPFPLLRNNIRKTFLRRMRVVSFGHGQNPILGRGLIGNWILLLRNSFCKVFMICDRTFLGGGQKGG